MVDSLCQGCLFLQGKHIQKWQQLLALAVPASYFICIAFESHFLEGQTKVFPLTWVFFSSPLPWPNNHFCPTFQGSQHVVEWVVDLLFDEMSWTFPWHFLLVSNLFKKIIFFGTNIFNSLLDSVRNKKKIICRMG